MSDKNKEAVATMQAAIEALQGSPETATTAPRRSADIFFYEGQQVYIRTGAYAQTGRVVRFNQDELVLVAAAWIADSGRFETAVSEGIEAAFNSEIEPYPSDKEVLVNRKFICDACEIAKLPTDQK